jgi:hypothetical protein
MEDERLVYFIECAASGRIKIGVSSDPVKRFGKIQTDSPSPLVLRAVERGGFEREQELHRDFAADRIRGEWFAGSGRVRAYVNALPQFERPRRCSDFFGTGLSSEQLMGALEVSSAYLSQMRHGGKPFTLSLALRLHAATGHKAGPIADATDAEVAVLNRFVFAPPCFGAALPYGRAA